MNTQIVLLDVNYNFLNVISIKKYIKLYTKSRIEIIKSSDKLLRVGFPLALVVRLLKAIKATFNKKIPFSKQSVFVRDNYICQYCEKELTAKNATIDHVLPRAKGGKNSYLNCVTACKACNSWKGDMLLSQLNLKLIKQPTHPSFSEYMYMRMKSLGIDLSSVW